MDEKTFVMELPAALDIQNVSGLFKQIEKQARSGSLEIDFKHVRHFDSSAIALVNHINRQPGNIHIKNLPPDFAKAVEMFGHDTQSGPEPGAKKHGIKTRVETLGARFAGFQEHFYQFLVLLADEIFFTFQYILKRRGVYPGEIFNQLFFMGYKSFPIVAVISFLVGVTISMTSAEQLRNFGADIYLADLIGFGMIRELAPLMTGIILAGKIGASITAEIASMKVMEETDALKTMGIAPEKFLMVPRLIAMTFAIPLLITIADFIGIFAGVLIARVVSDIPPAMFFTEMFTVVGLSDFIIGMGKTLVFGWVVVISAGYKGFSVERGATGVGIATTESVVLSISLIIIFDCIFALILY